MAKASGTTRRSTPRSNVPTVGQPRFAVGRSAGANRPVKRFAPMESRGTDATSRIDNSYKMLPRAIRNVERIDKIKDPAVYREVRRAISRFHSVLGVRETNFILADRTDGDEVAGTYHNSFGSNFIVLNKKFFNKSKKEILEDVKGRYRRGWSTKTNKPLAHTVTHELAHALWTNGYDSDKHKAAGREIRALRNEWKRDPDRRKLGYGDYASTHIDEFWAEVIAKAVHGAPDKYTRRAIEIVKKHKL